MKNNTVNLNECFCNGVKPTIAYEYVFLINEKETTTKNQIITGNELHELAGTNSDTHFIRMVTEKGKIEVGPLIKIDLTECGIERFIILPYKQEVLDLENCFCEGVNPFITYKYLIKINREKHETEKDKITGREILAIVGKNPDNFRLRMFTENGKKIIKPDEIVDLTKCGVERFICEPLDCTEGFVDANVFNLKSEDTVFLDCINNKVDMITEKKNNSTVQWLIIRDFDLPKGYNVDKSDIALLLPIHYPNTQIDMIYFNPPLKRLDSKIINQLVNQEIEGQIYQRWSRHRTPNNVWNPNIDNIESHLDLMMNCLVTEFKKR